MSDSTPTTPLPAPATAAAAAAPAAEVSSRRPLIILICVAAALLVGIIILLIALFSRGDTGPAATPPPSSTASDSPSPTPSETAPSPTPTVTETEEAAPPPAPTGPIQSFTASTTSVNCDGVSSVPVHFEWAADGLALWFGVGVNDAKAGPYGQYELVDELDFDYQCGQGSGQQKYTITVESAEGDLTSKSIIITE